MPDSVAREGRAILLELPSLRERIEAYSLCIRILWGHLMGRVKVNLTLDADVAETARALGLNMSRLAEAAIAEAAKVERNRRWRAENQLAIDAYAEEVANEGLPLAQYRSF